jgi:hypothetical protein
VSLDRMLTIDNVHIVSMEIAVCIPVVVSAFLVVLSSTSAAVFASAVDYTTMFLYPVCFHVRSSTSHLHHRPPSPRAVLRSFFAR